MRRSLEGLRCVAKDNYPSLPDELKEFNYFWEGVNNFVSLDFSSGRISTCPKHPRIPCLQGFVASGIRQRGIDTKLRTLPFLAQSQNLWDLGFLT